MLYVIIYKQGNFLDVSDDISEKNTFHMFSYKYLALCALI